MRFKRDSDGNWYNTVSEYYLGTSVEDGESFYQHLYDSGNMTLDEIICHVMESVNDSIECEGGDTYEPVKD